MTSIAANLLCLCPNGYYDASCRRQFARPRLTGFSGLDKETEGLVEALTLRAATSSSMIVDVLPCLSLFVGGATRLIRRSS